MLLCVVACFLTTLILPQVHNHATKRDILSGFLVSPVYAEDWNTELNSICSETQYAMNLSDEELKSLIGRCEKLRAEIEQLDGKQGKILLKRLDKCRNLFFFIIESRVIKQ
jgi:hypothetical protein